MVFYNNLSSLTLVLKISCYPHIGEYNSEWKKNNTKTLKKPEQKHELI